MMNKMLGFCCCAAAGMLAVIKEANDASRPRQTFLVKLMTFLRIGCPKWAGSRRPMRSLNRRGNTKARADARDVV
jgi:hypothetical protein